MGNTLSQVQAPAVATSMMGSIYGAAHTWDSALTLTDLFGYSGHAFILNIERTLCPSGPTAWDWGAILFPLRQLFSLKRICATCDMRDSDEARELIWQRTIESIDAGRPTVVWDALYPEFYLVFGYDETRNEYLVHGPGAERLDGRVPMTNLGRCTGRVWGLFPAPREAPDHAAARSLALRGAVTWHRWENEHDAQWIFGGEAWNVWIAAMGEEELPHESAALSVNHLVYAECRRHAADFLAAQGAEYAGAAASFQRVAEALQAVCAAWPFPGPIPPLTTRRALASHLAAARDAEADGIRAIKAVLDAERKVKV